MVSPADRWGGLCGAGQLNMQCPPSACECQQRAAPVSGSIRFPTYLPTVSDRGGRQQRGGEQREVAQRRGRTTEEAGKYIFLSLLSLSKSPVQFLSLRLFSSSIPPASHFVLLSPKPPNPSPFTPHSFLNPKSLLPSRPGPFFNCSPCTSLFPTSFLLSITPEHATSQHNPFAHSGWLQHTLFSLLHLLNPFPCFLCYHPLIAPDQPLFSWCRSLSTLVPDLNVTNATITMNVRINSLGLHKNPFSMKEPFPCSCHNAPARDFLFLSWACSSSHQF